MKRLLNRQVLLVAVMLTAATAPGVLYALLGKPDFSRLVDVRLVEGSITFTVEEPLEGLKKPIVRGRIKNDGSVPHYRIRVEAETLDDSYQSVGHIYYDIDVLEPGEELEFSASGLLATSEASRCGAIHIYVER